MRARPVSKSRKIAVARKFLRFWTRGNEICGQNRELLQDATAVDAGRRNLRTGLTRGVLAGDAERFCPLLSPINASEWSGDGGETWMAPKLRRSKACGLGASTSDATRQAGTSIETPSLFPKSFVRPAMGRQDKQDKDKKKKKKKREYHTVIEELDGTLVCSCSEFDATAKTCLQISAARLYRDFGPPERYSSRPREKKDSGSRNKRQKKEKPGATLKKEKGPRPPADHLIEDEHESFLQLLEDSEYDPFPAADESVKPQPSGTIGKCISSGRPAAITAHQPGRSPTKFSKKPGPKGHGYNSLLPPLSNKSPRKSLVKIPGQAPSGSTSDESSDSELSKPKVPPIPLKDKGKAKAAPESHDQGPAVMAEDLDILDIKFGRWDDEAYTLRQDEEFEICQLINALSAILMPMMQNNCAKM
ncbi:hypothetical protein C8F04DRAFT_1182659 [Mycena alexandri]|uniref:Uncharacterized protein n=1 Tax=Mycena alexandri TaxID=1745969 RepID=A0AAD6SY27_9AGAR|nr:hypothetical protein C8F04DRAFT_1182659 [Mycena alexandri]